MTCLRILACLAPLLLSACLDPLVGAQCADNLTVCGIGCSNPGGCGLDGGYDLVSLDVGSDDGGTGPSSSLDSSDNLDLGGAIDIGTSEATPVADTAARGADRSPDLAADLPTGTERPDGTRADTGSPPVADTNKLPAADAKDSPPADTSSPSLADVSDLPPFDTAQGITDTADAEKLDVADSAVIVGPDTRDAQADRVAADVVEASVPRAEVGLADTPRMDVPPKNEAGCPGQQISCGNKCVDDMFDPANCGGCGQACSAGTCRSGICKALVGGQIVVIGHDLQATNANMNRILTNAIFLSSSDPVQVAEYVGVAGATALANSHAAITEAVATVGRQVGLTQVTDADLPSGLAHADVFLIQSQTTTKDATLVEIAKDWTNMLSTFVHTGGIIVVLDGSYPTNSGTVRILVEAGLTNVAAVNVASGHFCSIKTATDPVAASLSATGYQCLPNSTSYKGAGIQVVEDSGHPVVLRFTF